MRKHKRKMLKIYKRKVIRIPKWAKRITVVQIHKYGKLSFKIGKPTIETTGYISQ